jgi:hypothetical protein
LRSFRLRARASITRPEEKTARVHRSTASQVVVPRGRPVEIAFANGTSS